MNSLEAAVSTFNSVQYYSRKIKAVFKKKFELAVIYGKTK